MANTTYSVQTATAAQKRRAVFIMIAVFQHMEAMKTQLNINFVSCIASANSLDTTFSDPLPAEWKAHIIDAAIP